MAIGKGIDILSDVLGYSFVDTTLLENALTHSSYSNEYKSRGLNLPSNERLEFLGDAVLEIVISEYLYESNKSFAEGKLSKMRQSLVCEKTLARIALTLSLGDHIHLGKGEEADCRTRPKVLADTLEAVIGAMYLDCKANGSEKYKEVILNLFKEEISSCASLGGQDYKSLLQQLVEKDNSVLEYRVTDESGPHHKRVFTVTAFIDNNEVGSGKAHSKKDAEMLAANCALRLFGILPEVKNEDE